MDATGILRSSARRRLLAFACALPLAGAAVAAGTPQVVGIAAAILNDVSIASGGTAQLRPAVIRERVALADRVQTGQRSQLQLMLLDRSTFTVGPNARLTIDRFVYDPARGGAFDASVAKGAFRFMSGRRATPGSSSIRTPVATVGIRGTVIDGVVGAEALAIAQDERAIGRGVRGDPETASLIVLRGPGAATQGGLTVGAVSVEAGGATVMLQGPMQAAFVPRPGAKPIGPFTISPKGLERIERLIAAPLAAPTQVAERKQGGGNAAGILLNVGLGILGAVKSNDQQSDRQMQTQQPTGSMQTETMQGATMQTETIRTETIRTETMRTETYSNPAPPQDAIPNANQVK